MMRDLIGGELAMVLVLVAVFLISSGLMFLDVLRTVRDRSIYRRELLRQLGNLRSGR